MQVRDIKRLLDVLGETDVRELTLETGEYKLTVRRGLDGAVQQLQQPLYGGQYPGAQPQAGPLAPGSAAPSAGPVAVAEAAGVGRPDEPGRSDGRGSPSARAPADERGHSDSRLVDVVAPIVGTFYAAASPDTPPYVSEGEKVKPGTVLCIIEAMKLMNEIEAEVAGTVREVLVENDEPVEYGQVLFRIEPD